MIDDPRFTKEVRAFAKELNDEFVQNAIAMTRSSAPSSTPT